MPAGLIRLLLTSFLIVFMIGGSRVCGCESLSWLGIEVRNSASSRHEHSSCCHHHSDHREEKGEEGESEHSHPEEPASGGGNCCDLALKSFNSEIPKKLSDLSDPSTFSEFPPDFLTELNLLNRSIEAATKKWRNPSPPILDASLERLFQQRFNV